MISDIYFKELGVEFAGKHLLDEFLSNATWEWVPFIHVCNNFGNDTTKTALKIWSADKFISDVFLNFKCRQRLYKIPSNSSYRWHKDEFVAFSLNMVLTDYDCKTIFEVSATDGELSRIKELKYIPEKWYAFNSQIPHMVINTDHRDRILYTILFYKEHGSTYQDFLKWYDDYITKK